MSGAGLRIHRVYRALGLDTVSGAWWSSQATGHMKAKLSGHKCSLVELRK
uniref:Uncharacterized protein n=1 Tax=Nomascus leucogenys TaxID=61853 RepID=A0A2I3GEM6_NOMLE